MGRDSTGKPKSEVLPGTLEMLILQTLRRRQMHGYGIAQLIRQASEDVLQIEEGSLYPALQRLELKDWVTAEWRTTENNRRAHYYCITPAGRRQLDVEAADFGRVVTAIARIMTPA